MTPTDRLLTLLLSIPLGALGAPATAHVAPTLAQDQASEKHTGDDPAATDDLPALLHLFREADGVRVTLDAGTSTVQQVVEEIAAQSTVPILVDWNALDRIGIREESEVTLRLENTTVFGALSALALQLRDDFDRGVIEAAPGQLVLTTTNAVSSYRVTGVYDIRDLLVSSDAIERLQGSLAEAGSEAASTDQAPTNEPSVTAGGTAPARPYSVGELFLRLLLEHVDEEYWRSLGGDQAHATEVGGLVTVSAPPGTHRRLQSVLRELRRAEFSSLTFQAAIITIERTELERLRRSVGGSQDALARVLLKSAASISWRTSGTVAVGANCDLSASDEGAKVEIHLAPSITEPQRILSIKTGVKWSRGAETRELSTTITIPAGENGAILEIAAPAAHDTATLFVLDTARQ